MNWRTLDIPTLAVALGGALLLVPLGSGVFGSSRAVGICYYALVGALPCVVTVVAKRNPCLWACLPYAILLAIYFLMVIKAGSVGLEFWPLVVLPAILVLLVSSGIGLFIRDWRERRAESIRLTQPTSSQGEPIHQPPEDPDVWPPAPKS